MGYNATARKYEGDRLVSTEAVEVDGEGLVIRACGHWSSANGTPEFDARWRASQIGSVDRIVIDQDGGRGYRDAIRTLALPPAYD